MYKVTRYFTDLQDDHHAYYPGDVFPRDGMTVTKERIEALLSGQNVRKKQFIEFVGEMPTTSAEPSNTEDEEALKETVEKKGREKESCKKTASRKKTKEG